MNRRWLAAILFGAAAIMLLWQTRMWLVGQAARSYFRQHGVESGVEIGSLSLSGISGRFALGPQGLPDVSAEHIELRFDPLRWVPRLVEVRLVNPRVRARIDADGRITLPSLQGWIDSLARQQGRSQFVSETLAVSLTGLRAQLSTPAGAVELDGNIKLAEGRPLAADLTLRPGNFSWRESAVTVTSAHLAFDRNAVVARFAGSVRTGTRTAEGVVASMTSDGLRWDDKSFAAAALHLVVTARRITGIGNPMLDMTARNIVFSGQQAHADITVGGTAGLGAPGLPGDRVLAAAVAANLARLRFGFGGHVERRGGITRFVLTAPLVVTGARGGVLRVPLLAMEGSPIRGNGVARASLSGGGLPGIDLSLQNLAWMDGGLTAAAALKARFNYAMLRGADISANGMLSWREGRYGFALSSCARAAMAAVHPVDSDLAKAVRGEICPVGILPLISGTGALWKFTGAARNASAGLPLADVKADAISANLVFAGQGGDFHGRAMVTAGRISDDKAGPRFKPLLGSGTAVLDGGVWRGRFAMTDMQKDALGDITFTHAMASGAGTARISAPALRFAPDKLQPENLSPLLVALRRAEGLVQFEGNIDWARSAIVSHGTLTIDNLDFMTPLGKAHAVKTSIAFTSLLPPVTDENQGLTISRIDWTLPFSAVNVRFTFSPSALSIGAASTDIAQGHAALDAFTVNPADPGRLSGAAQLTAITLSSLIAASNLGGKVKLEGKVSGRVPFMLTPEGFRIANGHIASDGPGRLSVDRSLWMQGDAALSTNAVQGFAYQALENLAFDIMTADLNSVDGGRLQIVFHIKGHNDPPRPQSADVAVLDILNGTALYKPIPLPSGTPIDLTLDTSLNFEELLKSYAEAWSKSLQPVGAPDLVPGAKP